MSDLRFARNGRAELTRDAVNESRTRSIPGRASIPSRASENLADRRFNSPVNSVVELKSFNSASCAESFGTSREGFPTTSNISSPRSIVSGYGTTTEIAAACANVSASRRRKYIEAISSILIFICLLVVASLVLDFTFDSLDSAEKNERRTENFLRDARIFVPAISGGTLPSEYFAALSGDLTHRQLAVTCGSSEDCLGTPLAPHMHLSKIIQKRGALKRILSRHLDETHRQFLNPQDEWNAKWTQRWIHRSIAKNQPHKLGYAPSLRSVVTSYKMTVPSHHALNLASYFPNPEPSSETGSKSSEFQRFRYYTGMPHDDLPPTVEASMIIHGSADVLTGPDGERYLRLPGEALAGPPYNRVNARDMSDWTGGPQTWSPKSRQDYGDGASEYGGDDSGITGWESAAGSNWESEASGPSHESGRGREPWPKSGSASSTPHATTSQNGMAGVGNGGGSAGSGGSRVEPPGPATVSSSGTVVSGRPRTQGSAPPPATSQSGAAGSTPGGGMESEGGPEEWEDGFALTPAAAKFEAAMVSVGDLVGTVKALEKVVGVIEQKELHEPASPPPINITFIPPPVVLRPRLVVNLSLPPGAVYLRSGAQEWARSPVRTNGRPRMGCCDPACSVMAEACVGGPRISEANASIARANTAPSPAPPPAPPVILPVGGVFAGLANVSVSVPLGQAVWVSLNGTAWAAYDGPWELGPGHWSVAAVTGRGGANSTAARADFVVVACSDEGDRCCRWMLLLARFEAALARLVAANRSEAEADASLRNASDAAERAWLDSESRYRSARATARSAKASGGYAQQAADKWAAAYGEGRAQDRALRQRVEADEKGVLDERALILEILAMMEAGQLKGPRATEELARLRRRVRSLRARQRLAGRGGAEMRALETVLASGRFEEADAVRQILYELLDDLNRRQAVDRDLRRRSREGVEEEARRADEWRRRAARYFALQEEREQEERKEGAAREQLAGLAEARSRALGLRLAADGGAAGAASGGEADALRAIVARIRVVVRDCRADPALSVPARLADAAQMLAAQVSARVLPPAARAHAHAGQPSAASGPGPQGRSETASGGLGAGMAVGDTREAAGGGRAAAKAAGGRRQAPAAAKTLTGIKGMLARLQSVLELRAQQLRAATETRRPAEPRPRAAPDTWPEQAQLAAAEAAAAAAAAPLPPAPVQATAEEEGRPAAHTMAEIKSLLRAFRGQLERRGAALRRQRALQSSRRDATTALAAARGGQDWVGSL